MRIFAKALLLACAVTAGCSGRVTSENFLKIKDGMQLEDVKLILGEPTSREGNAQHGFFNWKWREGDKEIDIYFTRDNRVMQKFNKGLN